MTNKPSFREALAVWVKIGLLSFGGPAGQIALMHRILVDEKRWISEARFLHALNYCMLLPGPEAQQLAIYIGWLFHRTLGGLVAGLLFVLPGALVILGLSVLYAGFHELTFISAFFFGVKAAVLAIVIEALIRISRRVLKSAELYAVAGAAFVALFFFNVPFPLIIAGAGLLGWLGKQTGVLALGGSPSAVILGDNAGGAEDSAAHIRPSGARALKIIAIGIALWFGPLALLFLVFGAGNVFATEAAFFSKIAVVTFGGAYAVLVYVTQEAVASYGWLQPGEMLDGLGLAETTPGPLILVLEFVGFLGAFRQAGWADPFLAGVAGAVVALWFTFVPCFLWIFLGAPYIEALRGNQRLNAALTAITAAVVGVILNLALWFALHVLFREVAERRFFGLRFFAPDLVSLDFSALVLTALAAIALFSWRLGILWTLAIASAGGLLFTYMPALLK